MRIDRLELLIDGFFRSCLQVFIDSKIEIITRNRILFAQDLYRTAGYIHFDLLATIFSTKFLVVDFFQAELAYDVAGLIPVVFHLLKFRIIDFTDIPVSMCCLLLIHVVTNRQNFDDNSRIIFFLLLNDGNDIRCDICFDANRIKTTMHCDFFLNVRHRYLYEF